MLKAEMLALLSRTLLLAALVACGGEQNPSTGSGGAGNTTTPMQIIDRERQLPRTVIDYDHALLDDNERRVVDTLIAASRLVDSIFFRQVSLDNPALRARLARDSTAAPATADTLRWFDIMKGPWDRLAGNAPFIGTMPKPPGAGFYPANMSKEEFERWIGAHPDDATAFRGLFSVIQRQRTDLVSVPYGQAYREFLQPAARLLRTAAALSENASLRHFLETRAEAFGSDDYYASDLAWMDLDSPIEIVIGPYEVYEDALFNYKASFEAFVTVVDRPESDKLRTYVAHLPEMERHLPEPDAYRNATRGAESPIRVVQEIFTAGDARRGVQTAAFNLPNDERVRQAKGSKKVLLKNVMEAKFRQSGLPIAQRMLDSTQLSRVAFAPYFNHTLFHELSHGLGPGIIKGPDGKQQEARIYLKDLYSTIEECKADVLGVWNLLYAIDQHWLSGFDAEALAATNVGLMFRSMRFGIDEAHGRGTAVQWNWLREQGAVVPIAGGRYTVVQPKVKAAFQGLATELLTIEATGDYARAKKLLDRYGVSNPEIARIDASLSDIPVDIAPVFRAAGER